MEALLYVFCMHAAPKPPEPLASLVSMNKSPFPLAIYACIGNRQFDWRVPLDWGCRARCAGDQAVAVQERQVSRVQSKSPSVLAVCVSQESPTWLAVCFIWNFFLSFHYKRRSSRECTLRVPSIVAIALLFFFISSPITLCSSYFVPVFCFW